MPRRPSSGYMVTSEIITSFIKANVEGGGGRKRRGAAFSAGPCLLPSSAAKHVREHVPLVHVYEGGKDKVVI